MRNGHLFSGISKAQAVADALSDGVKIMERPAGADPVEFEVYWGGAELGAGGDAVAPTAPLRAIEWRGKKIGASGGGLLRVLDIVTARVPAELLHQEDKALVWKHRASLTEHRHALLLLFKCMDWSNQRHVKQLLDIVLLWPDVDVGDALELLGEAYVVNNVQQLSVRSLASISDEMLMHLLLSLVQAMRHDPLPSSTFASFIVSRVIAPSATSSPPLLALELFWCLTYEKELPQHGEFYSSVLDKFCAELFARNSQWSEGGGEFVCDIIRRQELFVAACQSLALEVRRPRDSRQRQIERLRSLLSPGGAFSYMSSFSNAVRMPQQPSVLAYGILPEESTVLNSANFPLKLMLRVSGGAVMPVIVKTHHDLRRDKLVLNAISVMNSQLLDAGLDLKLKTYSVCAASPQCGFVEFVTSLPLSKVLADYNNDIRVFFSSCAPSSLHPSGIDPSVLDTFLRRSACTPTPRLPSLVTLLFSCAGYCVVSYLLGIGDRHLDNLMLTTQVPLTRHCVYVVCIVCVRPVPVCHRQPMPRMLLVENRS
jgi:phosphatidylinositol 3-kinase